MPKICEFENCRGFANYGEFYGKPIRCNVHKEEYKLANSLCREVNCKILPSYNYEGQYKAFYCLEHKKEIMVNVKSKTCKNKECKIQPSYNYNGESIGIYCSEHKKDGMINVKDKTCLHDGCKKIPVYNYNEENKGIYCSEHKKDAMINVKNKTCQHEGCKTRPIYNYNVENKGIYCLEHKKEGMINIVNKTCEHLGCKTIPNFNYNGEKIPLYCSEHKKSGMKNVISKICKANYCLGTIANPKYKGYCSSCYQHLFPNDPLTFQIRSKTKEIAVRDFINFNFEGFQHDKSLWTGNCECTHRRRIDHRKLIGNTLLCVETDENQHKNYDEKDEDIRYNDLFMLHGGKFIYIRFNSDKFKNKDGKSLNPMLYTRLPILKEEIEKQIERIKNEENIEILEIIKLYYNE